MPKTKSEEKPTIEAEHPAPDEIKKEGPEKQYEPIKIARAATQLASNESGTPQRAQATKTLQGAMGNARMGEMLALNQSGGGASPTIQRQPQGQGNPGSSTAGGTD